MIEVTLADARDELAEYVNKVFYLHTRVVLTRRGKPRAAIIPLKDLELLERIDIERAEREPSRVDSA